jgi:hypothetical protein
MIAWFVPKLARPLLFNIPSFLICLVVQFLKYFKILICVALKPIPSLSPMKVLSTTNFTSIDMVNIVLPQVSSAPSFEDFWLHAFHCVFPRIGHHRYRYDQCDGTLGASQQESQTRLTHCQTLCAASNLQR